MLNFILKLLSSLSIILIFSNTCLASNTFAKAGNIYFTDNKQTTFMLTRHDTDEAPILSPDEKTIVFSRRTGVVCKDCIANNVIHYQQLWQISTLGGNEKLLLNYKESKKLSSFEQFIDFRFKQFSSDSKYLYYLTHSWDMSNNLHRFDLVNSKDEFISSADRFILFDPKKCGSESERFSSYKDYIIVVEHHYNNKTNKTPFQKAFLFDQYGHKVKRITDEFELCYGKFDSLAGDY